MAEKDTLCVDARMYNHSGIGTYLQMVLPSICTTFKTTLIGDPASLSPLAKTAEIIPFYSPIYSISEQRSFNKVIPATDIFWSPHFNVPLLGIRCKKRIVTIHDVYHLAFYKELTFKQKAYAKLVMSTAVRISDEIITVSEFSKNELIKYTRSKSQKIHVIHNGVSQEPSLGDCSNISIKYALPDKYILFVGNVKPHKNLKTLIKAYLRLTIELRSLFKLVIVGKREGFLTGDEELSRWIASTPAIHQSLIFTGFVANEDLNTIYHNASLFVFPSLYEGFGLPPLEAMLNKCPVIVSNVSSLPEVCGDAALYFDPQNEIDLCDKLTQVLITSSLQQCLIEKGLQQIKKFRWSDSASQHIDIFNELLSN